jgi:hypothetical protein
VFDRLNFGGKVWTGVFKFRIKSQKAHRARGRILLQARMANAHGAYLPTTCAQPVSSR